MYRFGRNSRKNMIGVDHRLITIATNALKITTVDFGIPMFGGMRTDNQQYNLFKTGKSQLDGRTKFSKHQYGLALDVYAFVDGQASWDENHLALIACAMLQAASELGYPLRWGGHWKTFKDMPHFELTDHI